MQHHRALPGFLLRLSLVTRLVVVIGLMLIFLIIYSLLPKELGGHNPFLFVVPIVLIAWLFKRGGLFLTLLLLFALLWLCAAKDTGNIWPPPEFITAACCFLLMGLVICAQRDAYDEMDETQYQIALAYNQQQKTYEAKDQFLQNVNHELRTPLTAIYGYLDLLMEHNDHLDSDMRVTFLGNAMQNCDELQALVNNVLDSMSESREREKREMLPVEETAVLDVVHEVLERFDPKTVQEHTIYVDVPIYIVVLANPQYVRQVLRNLIANAFKYAPAGTPITISAELFGLVVKKDHPAPEICISVKDAGPGIPKDEQPLLFKQFVRLRRDTSSKIRGSGLGLYLSRLFVEMMQGRIWVESSGVPGEGSCFRFTLPCVPRPAIQAQIPPFDIYIPTAVDTPTEKSPVRSISTTSSNISPSPQIGS